MASQENAHVHKRNEDLLTRWTSNPDATVDDFRRSYEEYLAEHEGPEDAVYEQVDAGGVPAIWASTPAAAPDRVILHFHSGGYVIGSADGYKTFGAHLSAATGARVLVVDYRRAPENPFPAARDDALAAYRWVLSQGVDPASVAVCGDSAGGGLALALLQALRDAGEPLPAAGVAISPWADFALTGGSVQSNDAKDPLVKGDLLRTLAPMYAGETDVRHPGISPLYGDFSGLPPLLLLAGSIETLRDDARRCTEAARAAGTAAEYVEGEEMVHIWPVYADRLPEARETLARIGAFVAERTASGATAG
jgi:monoterpene epsilon-lactone hydrolase